MFRPRRLPVSIQPCSQSSLAPARTRLTPPSRRFLSGSPPYIKKRTWKGTFFRWGLAGGAVYWYNTSPLFAEDPARYSLDPKADHDPSSSDSDEESSGNTLESLAASRDKKRKEHESSILGSIASKDKNPSPKPSPNSESSPSGSSASTPSASDPAALSEEAGQEGAFNPVTGEINWDCPCLGGMAHGPCGEQFRAAFSCFVYSEEEPKGMDCIEKFQNMQDCFREHPDIYADELAGDDDDELDDADLRGGEEGGDDASAEERERKRELVREIREKRRAQADREADREAAAKPSKIPGEKRLLEVDAPVERKKLILKAHERETTSKGKS